MDLSIIPRYCTDPLAVEFSSCLYLDLIDENGVSVPVPTEYDYTLDPPPADDSWRTLPCSEEAGEDDQANLANWTNCARIVYDVYYEEFERIMSRPPKVSDVLAAVYRNELENVFASTVTTGINSYAGISRQQIAHEVHRQNYWSVVYELIPTCGEATCDPKMSAADFTRLYLVQVQSWYQKANAGDMNDVAIAEVVKELISQAGEYQPMGRKAVMQRWPVGDGRVRQWGNYGYGKAGYVTWEDSTLYSDTRVAFCHTVWQYEDGNGNNGDADYSAGDRWNDYRFAVITATSLDIKTSTYNAETDTRPPWLDLEVLDNAGRSVFYRNTFGRRLFQSCQ